MEAKDKWCAIVKLLVQKVNEYFFIFILFIIIHSIVVWPTLGYYLQRSFGGDNSQRGGNNSNICVDTKVDGLNKNNSVQMFNLHLQVYKFGWDTKEQKCRLVDVDPNKSPSTFLSTYVDLQVDDLGHANGFLHIAS